MYGLKHFSTLTLALLVASQGVSAEDACPELSTNVKFECSSADFRGVMTKGMKSMLAPAEDTRMEVVESNGCTAVIKRSYRVVEEDGGESGTYLLSCREHSDQKGLEDLTKHKKMECSGVHDGLAARLHISYDEEAETFTVGASTTSTTSKKAKSWSSIEHCVSVDA